MFLRITFISMALKAFQIFFGHPESNQHPQPRPTRPVPLLDGSGRTHQDQIQAFT